MDTAGELFFGSSSFTTLDLPLPTPKTSAAGAKGIAIDGEYGSFAQAFDQGNLNIHKRFGKPLPVWATLEFFKDSLRGPKKAVDEFLERIASDALTKKQAKRQSSVDHIAALTEDVEVIKAQTLAMLIAARDTAASLMSFACYLLAKHPEIMDRLRQEIVMTHGLTQIPTYDSLRELKYLRAVLNETLRLFPPVPVNGRTAKCQTLIPTRHGPVLCPRAEWMFTWSVISIHKRRDLWGIDAEDFVPERWLDERSKGLLQDPFRFIPFNAGPRICLGQVFSRFTIAQAEAAPLGCLLPDEWKRATQGRQRIEEIHPQSALTLYSKGGIWLRLQKATE